MSDSKVDVDRRVWKFPLAYTPMSVLKVPRGGVPVHVAEQDGRPCVWIDVDTAAPQETRIFHIRGTGHPVPSDAHYVGSWFVDSGQLVFHLYEAD
jgi:hypothetical protein